ncbi:hypothetical protein B0H14DRAFT_2572176 [Mycena olivaceomarginata]|nr:hypothetical protein B0H14DRAFT_2572176 [Mycena olivaceomarginata]
MRARKTSSNSSSSKTTTRKTNLVRFGAEIPVMIESVVNALPPGLSQRIHERRALNRDKRLCNVKSVELAVAEVSEGDRLEAGRRGVLQQTEENVVPLPEYEIERRLSRLGTSKIERQIRVSHHVEGKTLEAPTRAEEIGEPGELNSRLQRWSFSTLGNKPLDARPFDRADAGHGGDHGRGRSRMIELTERYRIIVLATLANVLTFYPFGNHALSADAQPVSGRGFGDGHCRLNTIDLESIQFVVPMTAMTDHEDERL